MERFDPQEDYILDPSWVLTTDAGRIVLYKLDLSGIPIAFLSPKAGLVAAMLDGERCLEEVAALYTLIFETKGLEQAIAECTDLLHQINRVGKAIIPSRLATAPPVKYDPREFMVGGAVSPSPRLSRPIRCMICPTHRCQTDCVYCYAERAPGDELSLAKWDEIFEELRSLEIRVVDVSGGDPMARGDSVNLYCRLIQNGFLFGLSTKCFISSPDAVRLAQAGFAQRVRGVDRLFQISLDSADPAQADRLTRTSGYFQRACESIDNLHRAGIPVRVKAVLTSLNFDQVEPIVTALVDRGVSEFCFTHYFRSGNRHRDSLWLSDAQKQEIAATCSRMQEDVPGIQLFGDAVSYRSRVAAPETRDCASISLPGMTCTAGWHSLGILPDGKVILCEQVPARAPFILGDLRRQSIMEVWDSREIDAFLRPGRSLYGGTLCFDCAEFEACQHGGKSCFRDAYKVSGTRYAPHPGCSHVANPPRMS